MEPYIQALKAQSGDFADSLRELNVDLGLVTFGDTRLNTEVKDFKPTPSVAEFRAEVGRIEITDGGDEPDSSEEGLIHALKMDYPKNSRLFIVLITDASSYQPPIIKQFAEFFTKSDRLKVFVVSEARHRPLYEPLCGNGGRFFDMKKEKIEDVLKSISQLILDQVDTD